MRSRRSKWLSGIGAVLVVGSLVLANYGTGITPAAAHPENQGNPFTKILEKLEEILTAITGIGGGGEGNHTLRWDTNNPSASCFVTAFPGAVLDKNTGLVWEQAPDIGTGPPNSSAIGGRAAICLRKNVGGVQGWRLSSVVELMSVLDPSLPAPFVPASVFTGVQSAKYWSSTIVGPNITTLGWAVDLSGGTPGMADWEETNVHHNYWCVRGPMQENVY